MLAPVPDPSSGVLEIVATIIGGLFVTVGGWLLKSFSGRLGTVEKNQAELRGKVDLNRSNIGHIEQDIEELKASHRKGLSEVKESVDRLTSAVNELLRRSDVQQQRLDNLDGE